MGAQVDRVRRHREIRAVIRGEEVASQDELVRALARRGFPITQATLSRDLRELRILRVPGQEGYRYAEAPDGSEDAPADSEARHLERVAALEVTGIDANESCVIVRTLTGRAQGVAVFLDGLGHEDLLATVAGDDTILVIPRSVKRTSRLRRHLAAVLGT